LGLGAILGAAVGLALAESDQFNQRAIILPLSSFLGANLGLIGGLILRKRVADARESEPKQAPIVLSIFLSAAALLLVYNGFREHSQSQVFWGLLGGLASFLPPALGTNITREKLIGAAITVLSAIALVVTRQFSWLIITLIASFVAYTMSFGGSRDKKIT
jgi:hypothetical protein